MLLYPSRLLATEEGRLYVADTGHHRILELELHDDGEHISGRVRRQFGTGEPGLRDGTAESATFNSPRGLALVMYTVAKDADAIAPPTDVETLYVADTANHAIRAINLAYGTVRTVAGTGRDGGDGQSADQDRASGTLPTAIDLRSPTAILGDHGELFIAMAGSHQIWVLLDEARLGPFAGNGRAALVDGPRAQASFNQPSDMAEGMGHVFVADAAAHAIRAIAFSDPPKVFTLAGQGPDSWGDVDGVGRAVRLQQPMGLAFGNGFIYIADTYNHKVKGLDPTTGLVETFIGTGRACRVAGPFMTEELNMPEGLSAAGQRLFIADTHNHALRVADLATARVRTVEVVP